jgi:AcrR family transcriptional regulator
MRLNMARYKKEERDQIFKDTRQVLFAAAAEEFALHGYVGANINQISLAAGLAKGTIYNYFESKRALMLALIDELAVTHFEFIADQVSQESSVVRRLERFFEAGFDWVTNHLAQTRVIFITLNGPEIEFKQYMYQAYQPMLQLVGKDILAAGMEQGVFRQVDAASTAGLLLTLYLGSISYLDEQGRLWLASSQVTEFVWNALRQEKQANNEVPGADR